MSAITQERKPNQLITSLASFVRDQFNEAKNNRETTGVNFKLLSSQRQYSGIYEASIKAAIEQMGGTDVYRRLTAMKCDTLVSWINEILLDPNDEFWEIAPTPIPDLPKSVKDSIVNETERLTMNEFNYMQGQMDEQMIQEFAETTAKTARDMIYEKMLADASEKAASMQKEIQDQMIDGKYNDSLFDFFCNYSIFQTSFLKGPLVRIEKKLRWVEGQVVPMDVPILTWYAPSPLDIYPSADCNNVQEGRIFEIVRYSREELYLLRNIPNYNREALDKLLTRTHTPPQLNDDYVENDRDINTNHQYSEMINPNSRTKWEGVEMWGSIPGYMLKDFGLDIEDVMNSYEAHVILIQDQVILATLNEDPLSRRPYYQSSYQYIPGAFWGISLPQTMEDIQRECNAAMRALCNNLAISSGPMVAYDLAQLPPDEDITKVYPGKIFTFDGRQSYNTRKAIEFYNPPSNVNELLTVYNSTRQDADNVTAIPSFAAGNMNVSGAAETASGLSILQGNLTKGIKNHVLAISKNVIKPSIERMYNWNMMYNPDEHIKGDCQIVVKGPLKVTTKEQKQMRLNEFLATTNNETDMAIIGANRRANLLREQARVLDLPVEEIVPTKEEMRQIEAQAQQQQMEEAQANEGFQPPPA